MSKSSFSIPVSEPEREASIEKLSFVDATVDFFRADMFLGLACQNRCSTRDELVDFALENRLTPYLKPFLERRDWLDDDWRDRLEAANKLAKHLAN